MLYLAGQGERLIYVAATAERLPLADHTAEIMTAAGVLDWVDADLFLPEAARVLVPGGWLVVYDIGERGWIEGVPDFDAWHQRFQQRFPKPPRRAVPMEGGRYGFGPAHRELYELNITFRLDDYIGFSMTQSNVTAAVEHRGEPEDGVRAWLSETLEPCFAGAERSIGFGGYIAMLQSSHHRSSERSR